MKKEAFRKKTNYRVIPCLCEEEGPSGFCKNFSQIAAVLSQIVSKKNKKLKEKKSKSLILETTIILTNQIV